MSIPVLTTPPEGEKSYIIDQFEGERLTIPGSKGCFRILASSKQTKGGIAVFTSGAVLSDAPGFHWHKHAHDVFLVTKGYQKLWNGDKCRIMGPGDFAYVPPVRFPSLCRQLAQDFLHHLASALTSFFSQTVIHNPELLGPHTETLGLVAPGDWIDFFRYVGESYGGVIVPESDSRDLKAMLIPKMMKAPQDYDVNFVRDYNPPEVGEWLPTENQLPTGAAEPYFLKANTGPRQLLGSVLSRPFIFAAQTEGKFAITSLEGSSAYGKSTNPLSEKFLTFKTVDHVFVVQEGRLRVKIKGGEWSVVTEGQTLLVAAGSPFVLDFGSRFVRAITFTNGKGIEELIKLAGADYDAFVLPEEAAPVDSAKLQEAAGKVDASLE